MYKEISVALSPQIIDDHFFKDKNIKKHIRIINTSKIEKDKYDLNFLLTGNISKLKCNINKRKGKYLDNILILFTPVSTPNSGHFQMLCKRDNVLYFFDSYGHTYVDLIKYVNNNSSSVKLNSYFADLILEYPVIYSNAFQYQTNDIHDATCGDHSSVAGLFFVNSKNPNFDKYYKFIEDVCIKNKLNGPYKYDDAVITIFKNMK